MRVSIIAHSSSTAQNYRTILSGAGAHGECATFDVWVGANGPEFIELDEILDIFVEPSNLLHPFTTVNMAIQITIQSAIFEEKRSSNGST
jgi:hypothetical protein